MKTERNIKSCMVRQLRTSVHDCLHKHSVVVNIILSDSKKLYAVRTILIASGSAMGAGRGSALNHSDTTAATRGRWEA